MNWKAHLYCVLTIIMFSTLEVAGKSIRGEISPFMITSSRFFIGGLVMLPFALYQFRKSKIRFSMHALMQIVALGILNVCLSMLILQFAIKYGKASIAAFFVSANPIFVMLFSFLLLREHISLVQVLGLGSGIIGLCLVAFGEYKQIQDVQNVWLGIVLALIATILFAGYTLAARKIIHLYGNVFTNSIAFLSGSIILYSLNLTFFNEKLIIPSLTATMYLIYLGVFVSGIAYLLYFDGIKHIGAINASMYFFMKPIIAGILAMVMLGESLNPIQIIGIALIIIGLLRDNVLFVRLYNKLRINNLKRIDI